MQKRQTYVEERIIEWKNIEIENYGRERESDIIINWRDWACVVQ